jgi:hypothetical protein
LSEKDLGRGTLEAKRQMRAQFPKGLHIWDPRPFMGSTAKIVKVSEDIKNQKCPVEAILSCCLRYIVAMPWCSRK